MAFQFSDANFFLCSGAAQVWSALMVFHILLIRDLKHHVEYEIENLWGDAKLWWPKLLVSLKHHEGMKAKLPEFGLTTETVLRADTHKNSFIRLIAAIKAHRIISDHLASMGPWEDPEMSPDEWQLKFEPIAERIQELEAGKPETRGAFTVGISGVALNMIACATGSLTAGTSSEVLLSVALISNLMLLWLFGSQVRRALDHFDITASHDALTEQIIEMERQSRRVWWRRPSGGGRKAA